MGIAFMIFGGLALLAGLVALVAGIKTGSLATIGGGVIGLLLGGGLLAASLIFPVGQGEAKVVLNADKSFNRVVDTPGFQVKAPWQDTVDFDLISQQLLYAGGGDAKPSYSGGEVQGQEVTVSVKGGTQANVDASIVYALDGNQVETIYKTYRSQSAFTEQVVAKVILSTLREVPAEYEAIDFRGKQSEIANAVLEKANAQLEPLGVTLSFVNIQDIRFSQTVEDALLASATAQQNLVTEQQKLEAVKIQSQQQVVEAQAEADANRLLSESLTPEVLESKRIDAITQGKETFVVPEGGSTNLFISPQGATPAE